MRRDIFRRCVAESVLEDAKAAAALMAMNTASYTFRHLVGKAPYPQLPARLRMQRMVTPASTKVHFELFSLACSALAGCETCIRSHEAVVTQGGLRPDQVNDAIRIAATLQGAAVALEIAESPAAPLRLLAVERPP